MRRVRQAVILADGSGAKLDDGSVPAALLPIGYSTLLQRQAEQLAGRGVAELTIVVGHLADMVRESVGQMVGGMRVSYIHNDRFAEGGTAASLLLASAPLTSGEPVLLSRGDLVYDDVILDRCLSAHGSVLAADSGCRPQSGDVSVVRSRLGNGTEIRKSWLPDDPNPAEDQCGVFIGLAVLEGALASSLIEMCRRRVPDAPWLDYDTPLLSELMSFSGLMCQVSYTSGIPWINLQYLETLNGMGPPDEQLRLAG